MTYEIETGLESVYVYDDKDDAVASAYLTPASKLWTVYKGKKDEVFVKTVSTRKEAVEVLKDMFPESAVIT